MLKVKENSNKIASAKEKVFKVYSFKEKSIRSIYQSRVYKILEITEIIEDVNEECRTLNKLSKKNSI